MVLILGLHLSHNSTACLMEDGKIIAAVQQERFDRKKNSGAFPKDAINWVLKAYNVAPHDIDAVAVGGLTILPSAFGLDSGVAGSKNVPISTKVWRYIDYRHPELRKLFYPLALNKRERLGAKGRDELKKNLLLMYGIPGEKIHFVEHHICHAYTAYYGLHKKGDDALIFTLDGEGDYYCASVNRITKEGIERVASTPQYNSLGYIYSQTTTYMGMKALEHEYKVMGLAPYAKEYFMQTYRKIFEPVLDVNEKTLEFTSKFPTNRFINHLKENAVGERFDNVAASVQYLTETRVSKWVHAAMKKLQSGDLYLGGGVFMNVKLNMKLAEIKEVSNVHPFPSCGDESNPFGACYYVYLHKLGGKKHGIEPVRELYLGPEFTNEDVKEMIRARDLERKYDVEFHKDVEGEIAELLAKGEVVARVCGKGEWGARSLGNRAILANPSGMESFYKVNDQIKMRDFWMPFAPTILKEREEDYILNPKNLEAPYMIMAFHSTPKAQKELVAAIHQADKTCRPQLLERSWNERYYRLVKEFEKETGIGGVLNTSLNLHGLPMVSSPEDALYTLENSGLGYLAIENYIISKK